MFVIRLGRDNYYHCDFCNEFNASYILFEGDFDQSERYICNECLDNEMFSVALNKLKKQLFKPTGRTLFD